MKDELIDSLGSFGLILWFALSLFKNVFPAIMIADSLIIAIGITVFQQFVPLSSVAFWIWGMVCAVRGEQDVFAYIYYISFAVLFLPFFIKAVFSLINIVRK